MASGPRVLYLIGQFPAINHGYLLAEIRHLRRLGIDVRVASVNAADRPPEKLSALEREEVAGTYYIKATPLIEVLSAHLAEGLRHPLRYLRGAACSLKLGGPSSRSKLRHLAYFAEAVLLGRKMRSLGITHVHASFSATVAVITTRVFPVTMSFGVYGFGDLHDPVGTRLAERIASSLFVRSINRHGRGQALAASHGAGHKNASPLFPASVAN